MRIQRLSVDDSGVISSEDVRMTVISKDDTDHERKADGRHGQTPRKRDKQATSHEVSSEKRKESTEKRPISIESERTEVERPLNGSFRTDLTTAEMEREFGLFVTRRFLIWKRRAEGLPADQWTIDPILRLYRFCNVFRVLDRASQWAVEQIDSDMMSDSSRMDVLLFCWLFRRTNGADGWNILVDRTKTLPTIGNTVRGRYFDAMETADKMTPLATSVPYNVANGCSKGSGVLRELRADTCRAFSSKESGSLFERLADDSDFSWKNMIDALRECRRIGPFLAQQIVTDFGYSKYGGSDWEWNGVLPGPGSRRGLMWIYPNERWTNDSVCSDRILDLTSRMDGLTEEMIRLNYNRMSRPLSPMDVQNCLCEFDKYQRLRNGTGFYRRVYSSHRALRPLSIPRSWWSEE